MKKQLFVLLSLWIVLNACTFKNDLSSPVRDALRNTVLKEAAANLHMEPATVTAFIAERSAGGPHDFFSEGDYWWPDSLNPAGPYIRRDGETNPDNFVTHRHAMIRFSTIVGNLTSAYLLTGDEKYVNAAMKHVKAWFVNSETRMNPHLLYAQAIKGITTGRGVGIIDTIHLIEVVQSLIRLEEKGCLSPEDLQETKKWVETYLAWMTTHPYGVDEMNATNNHATCWAMQAAIFAKYTGNKEKMHFCAERFKNLLLPQQMKEDGSFPRELGRTKPYGYSLFNLDAMATLCEILSSKEDNLWEFSTADGKSMLKGMEFMHPFIKDKTKWSYGRDVMYWDEWPVAQPALLFAWKQYGDNKYLDTWLSLDHFPQNEEVLRNLPVRNPLIWL